MNDDELLAVATTDSTERTTEQEIGLIGGMLDNHIVTFEFRGLRVSRDEASIVVTDPDSGRRLGGEYAIRNADLNEVHDWLTNKARNYGMEVAQ